jgi:hypothetical protein
MNESELGQNDAKKALAWRKLNQENANLVKSSPSSGELGLAVS